MASKESEALSTLYKGWIDTLGKNPDLPIEDVRQLFEHWGDVTAEPGGVDYVEAGYPGANPKDDEFFRRAPAELKLATSDVEMMGRASEASLDQLVSRLGTETDDPRDDDDGPASPPVVVNINGPCALMVDGQDVPCRAVAYMAFGYAQSTGRLGVYSVVPGPGMLNASAALASAI